MLAVMGRGVTGQWRTVSGATSRRRVAPIDAHRWSSLSVLSMSDESSAGKADVALSSVERLLVAALVSAIVKELQDAQPHAATVATPRPGHQHKMNQNDCRHLRTQEHRADRRRRRAEVGHAPGRARPRLRRAQGLDRRRRARLRRRRDLRRRVREPPGLPAADERAEAAAAVPGARHVRRIAARP